MRVALIINPVSGISTVSARQLTPEEKQDLVLAALQPYGIVPEVYETTAEDPGRELAARLARQGLDLVIVAGGDGTVHAVAHGLIGSTSTLGIIPAGTMNNLAHSLAIPTDIEEACAVIAQGQRKAVDVGKINGHIFLEVAGIGLEAVLFPPAEEIKSPGLWSTIHGVLSGLRTLFAFKPPVVRVSYDMRNRRFYRAIQLTICNTPYYGAHLRVAPDASMDDGMLDLVIYRNFSKVEYLRHALSISRGMRTYMPKIKYRRVKSIRITADRPVEIQADGMPIGHTPADIQVVPKALYVMAPSPSTTRVEQSEHTPKAIELNIPSR